MMKSKEMRDDGVVNKEVKARVHWRWREWKAKLAMWCRLKKPL